MDESLIPFSGGAIETYQPQPDIQQAPNSALSSENFGQFTTRPSAPVTRYGSTEPPRLTKDGKVSERWLEWLSGNYQSRTPQAIASRMSEYGDVDDNEGWLDSLAGIPRNPSQFLEKLWDADRYAYSDLVREALSQHAGELGLTGEPSESGTSLDHDDWLDLRPEHRDIALSLPQTTLDEIMLAGPDVRDELLERERERQLLWAERDEAIQQAQYNAQVEGLQNVQNLSDAYERGHYQELNKWKPVGSDEHSNQRARKAVLDAAYAELRATQRGEQMFQNAYALLTRSPLKRLQGDLNGAASDEHRALELAKVFNAELGVLIKQHIGMYGKGSKATPTSPPRSRASGEPARLNSDGRVSNAWLEWVASKM